MFFFFDDDDNIISPHTIKKFELISEYTKAWIQKLMNNPYCEGVVFIDCMSNSGVYHTSNGDEVEGTPIRVARIISEAMRNYPNKYAHLYFNDWSSEKIATLESRIPENTSNFIINTSTMDGNELLKILSEKLKQNQKISYLLVYDPYQATIDWDALGPYFRGWGEVIINHMLSDSIRAAKVVKKPEKRAKYENTYQTSIDDLIKYGSDKKAFENRIEEIISSLSSRPDRECYIAAFPFFNTMNTVVFNLIHCTSHIEGFKLYKKTAWKVFENKSSMKNTHHENEQMVLCFDDDNQDAGVTSQTDEYCYYIQDIAKYVQEKFKGQKDVLLNEIWALLDIHPVFPSEGYRIEIKKILEKDYGATVSRSTITFTDRRG